jgi:GTP-binding protein
MPASPNARFVTSCSDPAQMPATDLPQIALLGRSNAGKSSLINALTGIKGLAKTSATPGRTRLINIFDAGRYQLVDLPGYGYAKGSHKERDQLFTLVDGYLDASPSLRLAIVIVDSRLGPTDSDREMIEFLQSQNTPLVLIANKIDKLSRTEQSLAMRSIKDAYPHVTIIAHSVVSGVGKGELMEAIDTMLRKEKKLD